MMNTMQVFMNEQFGQVRTVLIEGEPWFVGKDVATALGYSNTKDALARHVDASDKRRGDGVVIPDPIGRPQTPTVINESGLYCLIFSSKLPDAIQFKLWITREVLPSIRKYGAYITDSVLDQVMEQPEVIYSIAEKLVSERDLRKELQRQLDEAQPKLAYFDTYIDPRGCTCIRNSGKLMGIPQKVFVSELLSHKIFFRDPTTGRLLPYSIYEKKGYFIVRDVLTKAGTYEQQTRITPTGKEFLMKKFKQWKGAE